MPITIYEFNNYRKFLNARYQELKKKIPAFSHRYFSQKAGLKSSNYLQLIMSGARDLGYEAIPKFAKGLKLRERETEYFNALVRFNKSKTVDEREKWYQEMMRLKKAKFGKISDDQYSFYADWYVPVVREIIGLKGFRPDKDWIRTRIVPPIGIKEVNRAIQILKKQGFIKIMEDGKWKQAEPAIATENELDDHRVMKFHNKMIDLAKKAQDLVPQKEREISSLTISCSAACIQDIKRMIQDFQDKLLARVVDESESEEVHQINFQMFPLSRRARG